jgi:ABC-type transport system involved in multi-copper enzyme maturation permease subunit
VKAILIARLTFREALRKRIMLGAIVLTLEFLALFTLGAYFAFGNLPADVSGQPGRAEMLRSLATSQMTLASLYVVNFMGGLLAVFASVGTISSEIEQGTLHAIVPKPLRRSDIVLGKWLGYAVMVSVYVLATSAMVIGVVYILAGYLPPDPVQGLLLMVFAALILLSLSMLGSTFLSAVTGGITVLILYAIALIGGMVEQIGTVIQNDTMLAIGTSTSIALPSDMLWRFAAHLLQPPLPLLGARAGPFSAAAPAETTMLAFAVLYMVASVGAAALIFQRRDL